MANTIIIYQGDGSTTDFAVPFDYLRKSFVRVFLNRDQELVGGATNDVNSDYYFVDPTTIRLRKIVPTVNQTLTVRRYTSGTDRVASFRDGSVLYAKDLDTSQVQAFHIAEEARDIFEDSLNLDVNGRWNAKNQRIVNVGTPIDSHDATTKEYVDKIENDAGIHADSARASAGTAVSAAKVASEKAFEVKEWHQKVKALKDNVVENTALVTSKATIATQKASEAAQSAQRAEAAKTVAVSAKESALASATTASEKANIATEKAMIATEKAQALEQAVNALKYAEGVSALKKQVANLQAQAEGKLFVYETDATEAYSKDVPEGVYPYAAVKNFGGKTIVWNQFYKALNNININSIDCMFSTGNTVTVNAENVVTGDAGVPIGLFTIESHKSIVGHKYFYSIGNSSVQGETWQVYIIHPLEPGSQFNYRLASGVGYAIVTAPLSVVSELRVAIYAGFSGRLNFTVNVFDLTQMFGAGNEPTAEEFLRMFPDDYYEYNAGELKSAPINNLKIRGQNILPTDLKFTQGSSSSVSVTRHDDGSITLNGTASKAFAMKGSLPETEGNYQGKSLILSSGNPLPSGTWLSWGNGTPMIVGNGSRTSSLAIGSMGSSGNCFYLYTNSGTIFNNLRIYPMLTAYREEKEYKPYSLKVRQIPQAVLNLEGYGWSAGTAKNWIDWENKKYHREVASVDLGTLAWTSGTHKLTNGLYFFTSISDGAYTNSDRKTGSILAKYTISKAFYTQTSGEYCFGTTFIYSGQAYLQIKDDAYTKVEDFKKSISGEIFYYELAEPEIIDISDILPYDNLIEVEEGGMITFENSNGDGFRIPVPSEIVYQKKVTTNE